MADVDPFAQYIAPEAKAPGDDPFAAYVAPEAPAAPAPPSLAQRAKAALGSAGSALAQPFVDIGHGLMSANRAVAGAIEHPVDTFNAIRANPGAYGREAMRGVNDNIPLANRAVQAMGGPAAESPEDAEAAPGARAVGGVAGLPAASMVGGIAAKGIEAAAPVVSKAVKGIGESAQERQVARAKEAMEMKVTKRTRMGLRGDAVDAAIAENPQLRAAAGNDAKLAQVTQSMKEDAASVLDKAYTESPTARATGTADLKALEAKAKIARARADELAAAGPGPTPDIPMARPAAAPDPAMAFWEGHPNAEANPLSLPTARAKLPGESPELSASWSSHAVAADEAKAAASDLEQQVAAKRKTAGPGVSTPPPVSSAAPLSEIDRRISALKATKIPNDAAAASQLEAIRGKLANSIGEDGTIDPRKLRKIQSDYQREGYAKNINDDPEVSARIRANREASKAVGDAVLQHVTGMDYTTAKAAVEASPNSLIARIFKANEQIEAANKIEAGIAERASKPTPKHGLLKTAAEIKHSPTGYALSKVPEAADAAASAVDNQLAKLAPARAAQGLPPAGAPALPPVPPVQPNIPAGRGVAVARLLQMARTGATRAQLNAQAAQDGTPVELAANIAQQFGR